MKGKRVNGGPHTPIESPRIMRSRRIRAVVAIAMLVGIPFAGEFLNDGSQKDEARQSVNVAALHAEGWIGGSVETLLDGLEERLADSIGAAPEVFEREIGFLPNARDVRVSDGGQVVGYVVEGEERAVAADVETLLLAKGWAALPLEGVSGATFAKNSGCLRWALATCTQVSNAVSVVTRCLEVEPS